MNTMKYAYVFLASIVRKNLFPNALILSMSGVLDVGVNYTNIRNQKYSAYICCFFQYYTFERCLIFCHILCTVEENIPVLSLLESVNV